MLGGLLVELHALVFEVDGLDGRVALDLLHLEPPGGTPLPEAVGELVLLLLDVGLDDLNG